jgi:hypothetical protein
MHRNSAAMSDSMSAMCLDQGAMFGVSGEMSEDPVGMSGNAAPKSSVNTAAFVCSPTDRIQGWMRKGVRLLRAFLVRTFSILHGMTKAHWWFGMTAEEYDSLEPQLWDDVFLLEYGLLNKTADVLAVRVEVALLISAEQRFERMMVFPRTPLRTLPGYWLAILFVLACRLLGLRAAKARHVRVGALALPGRMAGRSLYARPPPFGAPSWSVR